MTDANEPRGPFFGGPPLQLPAQSESWSTPPVFTPRPLRVRPRHDFVVDLQRPPTRIESEAAAYRRLRKRAGWALLFAAVGIGLLIGRWTNTPSAPRAATAAPAPARVLSVRYPQGCTLRAGPTVSSAAIGRAEPGQSYDVEASRDGWRRITLEDGLRGWVGCR